MTEGVVAILTGPDGYVWATATDFDRSGYGGFSLQEAQELRVKKALAYTFMHKSCNDAVMSVIDGHRCEEIVNDLIRQKGFKRTIVVIGHEETRHD